MRSPPSKRWTVTAVLAIILLQLISPAIALICDFNDAGCIDPLALVSVPVAFEPLFSSPISFFYGFDAQAPSDPEQQLLPAADRGPMIKVSFWLQYDQSRVGSSPVQANRTTEIALRIGNLTGYRGGENHGCDGVWGPQCSQNLKAYLRNSIYDLAASGVYYSSPLEAVLQQMSERQPPPTIPSCPTSLFQVDVIPVKSFVEENELDQTITVDYPGSSAFPWRTWYIQNTTPPEQAVQVAVGIFSRGPSWGSAPLNSADDVQIELVCVRAPREQRRADPDKVDDVDDDDDEDCYPPA
ncbi:hypothetical protein VTN77DRAFT_8361 [Rasamsonia byssochlamydoides]|uniref:uncharacterized protein n=1 Tax=Rasamsonia byssochlamydoides TaxID=89139 RepID=UPI003743012B